MCPIRISRLPSALDCGSFTDHLLDIGRRVTSVLTDPAFVTGRKSRVASLRIHAESASPRIFCDEPSTP